MSAETSPAAIHGAALAESRTTRDIRNAATSRSGKEISGWGVRVKSGAEILES